MSACGLHVLENEVVEPSIVNLAGFGKTSGTRCVDAAHLVYHKQNNNNYYYLTTIIIILSLSEKFKQIQNSHRGGVYLQMICQVEVVVDVGRMILASRPGTWRAGGTTLHILSDSYTSALHLNQEVRH